MSGAEGKSTRFFPAWGGVDQRVWQAEGRATEATGVVFAPTGEVRKAKGISPCATWPGNQAPFFATGAFLGLHTWGGQTDVLLSHGTSISLLRGNTLTAIATNLSQAIRVRDQVRFTQIGTRVFLTNGRDRNMKWDGRLLSRVGVHTRPKAPDIYTFQRDAAPGTDSFFSSLWLDNVTPFTRLAYKQTWTSMYGQESEASPASVTVIADSTAGVADPDRQEVVSTADSRFNVLLVLDAVPGQDELTDRTVYRSVDGGAYTFLQRISGSSTRHWVDAVDPTTSSTLQIPADGANAPPPIAKWCFPFRSRVYYLGPDLPSHLRYSSINAPEAVPATNLLDVVSTDGDVVTAYSVARDYVVIFKRNSIYLLTHDKDERPQLMPVSQGVGCVGDFAVKSFDGVVYFMSAVGIHSFDGAQARSLSAELETMVRNLPGAYLPDVVAFFDPLNRRIYFSVNAGGTGEIQTEVWAIQLDTGAVSVLRDFPVESAAYIAGRNYVIYRSINNAAPEWDIGLFDAIDAIRFDNVLSRYMTKFLDWDSPASDKTWKRLDIAYVQTGDWNTTVEWYTDWDSRTPAGSATFRASDPAATIWGEGDWDTAARVWDKGRLRTVRIDLSDVTSKSIAIRFRTDTLTVPARLVGFYLTAVDHGLRSVGTDIS